MRTVDPCRNLGILTRTGVHAGSEQAGRAASLAIHQRGGTPRAAVGAVEPRAVAVRAALVAERKHTLLAAAGRVARCGETPRVKP